MRHALLLTVLGLTMQMTAADAQTVQYGERSAVIASQLPTRINVAFNISQRVSTSSFDEQRRVDQIVRRKLYQLATEECALLVDVIGGECRITSLSVNSNFQDNPEHPMVNGNMNGQYEVVPRR